VIALDPGTVRIGVAVSDSRRTLAFPRPSITAGEGEVDRCAQAAREEGASTVVVGHPLRLDGSAGEGAGRAESLASALAAALAPDGVDVELHDERFTTVSATDRLREAGVDARRGRSKVDGAAATVLLESWMGS
jgi:putative Holliday junction resolvase